jgi:negative regulator of replication initiation
MFWDTIKRDEAWVVAEVGKGWAALEAGVHAIEIDIKGLFDYVAAHQQQIDATAQSLLSNVSLIAALAGHPEVSATAAAIGASAQAITALAANVDKGAAPLSEIVTALHTVKDAQTAVNSLVKVATAKPKSTTPSATP